MSNGLSFLFDSVIIVLVFLAGFVFLSCVWHWFLPESYEKNTTPSHLIAVSQQSTQQLHVIDLASQRRAELPKSPFIPPTRASHRISYLPRQLVDIPHSSIHLGSSASGGCDLTATDLHPEELAPVEQLSNYTGDVIRELEAKTILSKEERTVLERNKAGAEGERLLQEKLAREVGAKGRVMCGYHTTNGEIDCLAVMPYGILAIEVKHVAGDVRISGETWTRDRSAGRRVEHAQPMQDARNRSPSAQLNASVDQLQALLSRKSIWTRIKRVIVLTHPRGRIASRHGLSVDLLVHINDFQIGELFDSSASTIDVDAVCELIRRNHAENQRYYRRPVSRERH